MRHSSRRRLSETVRRGQRGLGHGGILLSRPGRPGRSPRRRPAQVAGSTRARGGLQGRRLVCRHPDQPLPDPVRVCAVGARSRHGKGEHRAEHARSGDFRIRPPRLGRRRLGICGLRSGQSRRDRLGRRRGRRNRQGQRPSATEPGQARAGAAPTTTPTGRRSRSTRLASRSSRSSRCSPRRPKRRAKSPECSRPTAVCSSGPKIGSSRPRGQRHRAARLPDRARVHGHGRRARPQGQSRAPIGPHAVCAGYEAVERADMLGQARRVGEEAVAHLKAPSVSPGVKDLVLLPTHLGLTIHESIGHSTELDRALGYEANLRRHVVPDARQARQVPRRLRDRQFQRRSHPAREPLDLRLRRRRREDPPVPDHQGGASSSAIRRSATRPT